MKFKIAIKFIKLRQPNFMLLCSNIDVNVLQVPFVMYIMYEYFYVMWGM